MDLEKIERALERCRDLNEVVKHSDATDGDHERLFKECMVTVTLFGPDLLRLVRAMRWMAEGGVSIEQIEAQMNETTNQSRAT